MSVTVAPPKLVKFRLLRGTHEQSEEINGVVQSVMYYARDPSKNIVVSALDLERIFGREKFQSLERIQDSSETEALRRQVAELQARLAEKENQSATSDIDFDGMTVADLKKMADDFDVELEPGLKKDEIINVLRSELDK